MGALAGLLAGVGLLLIWRSGSRAPQRAARRRTWTSRREELIVQAGIESVSSVQLLTVQALAGALTGLVVELVTGTAAVAICFALFGLLAPIAIVRRMRLRRQVALRELWPEAIDNLASAVRAGMSLPEGVSGLSLHGPAPLRPAFARFASSYRASGRFAECLDGLKRDLADPVGDRVCETLRVAREVGGTDLGCGAAHAV